jgi:hypothetical protein
MNPIHQIKEFGIPTDSYHSAIRHLNDRDPFIKCEYERLIHVLTGVQRTYTDQRDARYCFLYLIQETIRKSDNTDRFDMPTLLIYAEERAYKFIKENPWHWAVVEEEVKLDSSGKPKRKKGAKQVEALRIYNENIFAGKKAIIELFMSELDMSKAGATTYFYNTRKQVGG